MLLLLLKGGGAPGPTTISFTPADLTWVGQSLDIIQSGGPTEITFDPADLTWVGQDFSSPAQPTPLGSIGAPMAFLPIKYATAVTIPFDIIKASTLDYAATGDWTPATGDVKISIDGGAFTNVGTLPSVLSGTDWGQVLTTGETTGKFISIKIIDTAPKAVDDQALKCFTYGHASAYWPFDLSSVSPGANVLQWNSTNVASPATAGYPAVTVKSGTGTGEISLSSGGVLLQGTTHTSAVIPLVTDLTTKTGYALANPAGMKKNTAQANVMFEMRDSAGLLKTGLTVAAQRSIDGGAFGNCANSVTEIGSTGVYKIDIAATDNNGDCIMFLFTATGSIGATLFVLTET